MSLNKKRRRASCVFHFAWQNNKINSALLRPHALASIGSIPSFFIYCSSSIRFALFPCFVKFTTENRWKSAVGPQSRMQLLVKSFARKRFYNENKEKWRLMDRDFSSCRQWRAGCLLLLSEDCDTVFWCR